MVFVPTTPLDGKRRTSPLPVAVARGYGVHYLKNAAVFWAVGAFISASVIASALYSEIWRSVAPPSLVVAAAGVVLAAAIYRGGRALRDLLDEPISFEGKVAGKSASLFWNRLTFLEDKFHLRIVRGDDHRPISYGTGFDLREGWFLAGKGYHDIVSEGTRVRGQAYRRTRVIDSLVKL